MALKRYVYIIGAFLLAACAQVSSPTGGPKDETPPRDSVSFPANFSTSFKQQKISIRFTEFITLQDLNNQFAVSPFSLQKPDISVKGKFLHIQLKDSLQANTTYSFHFGKAIRDITEGNAAEDFIYVFSTGQSLDTAFLKGTVLDAFTQQPIAESWVMLYAQHDDSLPLKSLPDYAVKTNKEGVFAFSYIKEKPYKMFALKDNNRNYLFDLPDEMIAFSDTLVAPFATITLQTFTEDNAKQFVKSSEEKNGQIRIVMNKPSPFIQVLPIQEVELLAGKTNATDTILFFLKGETPLSSLKFAVSDSGFSDTISIRITAFEKLSKQKLSFTSNLKNARLDIGSDFKLSSTFPLEKVLDSLCILYADSLPIMFAMSHDSLRDIRIHADWEEGKSYELMCMPGFANGMYGNTHDTIRYIFSVQEKKFYGNLNVKISVTKEQAYIFYLLDAQDNILKREYLNSSETFQYTMLSPGNHKFKIIADSNHNQKWDTGNYTKGIQPEKVYLYPNAITIKSNWDQDIEWIVN